MDTHKIWSKLDQWRNNIELPELNSDNYLWLLPMDSVESVNEMLEIITDNYAELDTILEIGIGRGGSHCIWKQIAKNVITVEYETCNFIPTFYILQKNNILENSYFIIGDSQKIQTMKLVKEMLKSIGKETVDILFVDGNHEYRYCKTDHEHYSKFVRKGGMVLFHDYCSGAQVQKYVEEISNQINMKTLLNGQGWAYYEK